MIERDEVRKLAGLARITISPEEEVSLQKEIESILAYVSEIKGAGREEGEPQETERISSNVMREDGEPHEGGAFTEDLLGEVPKRERGFVRVKRILT